MADDTCRHLLVVICELSPTWWGRLSENASERTDQKELPIDTVAKFSHVSDRGRSEGEPAFETLFIYPSPKGSESEANAEQNHRSPDGKYEHFAAMNNVVFEKVKGIIEEECLEDVNLPDDASTLLSGALSMSLCYIKQAERNCPVGQHVKARILVLKGSQDVSTQYMATMNCIFAAQKNNIAIDSCLLMSDSGFLQQASDITGGMYFKVMKMESLLQYLLWMFLPAPSTRESLVMPGSVKIDYRAACFCHRTLVDIGFVCSVCLSIYCQLLPRCHTCQTRFKLPTTAMARTKRKRKDKTAD